MEFSSLGSGDIPAIPGGLVGWLKKEKYDTVVLFTGLGIVSVPYIEWQSLIIWSFLLSL